MTKVPRKPREPRTIMEQPTPRTKRKKQMKTPYQGRSREGGKLPFQMQNTPLTLKGSHQGTSRKVAQTSCTRSRKPKKAKRSTIHVCYHSLNKKGSRSKRQKPKRGKPSKSVGQTKRRGQLEKKREPVELSRPPWTALSLGLGKPGDPQPPAAPPATGLRKWPPS